MDETLFYLCGGLLIASGLAFVLSAAVSDRFPGNGMPLLIGWLAVLGLGAITFALLGAHEEGTPHAQEYARNGVVQSAAAEAGEEKSHAENEVTGEGGPEFEEQVPGAAEEMEGEAGPDIAGGKASLGTIVFSENCSTCHGGTGHGGNGGPDLRTMPLAQTEEGAIQQVTNGGGGMPAFKGVLSEEEIENVAAYVAQEITHGE